MAHPASATNRRTDFTCQFCGRLFKRLEHVQRHERTHTKEAPFTCHCGDAFQRRDLLTRHERLAHKGRVHNGRRRRAGGGQRQSMPGGDFNSTISSEENVNAPDLDLGYETRSHTIVRPDRSTDGDVLPDTVKEGQCSGIRPTTNDSTGDGEINPSCQSTSKAYSQTVSFTDGVNHPQNGLQVQGLVSTELTQGRPSELPIPDPVDSSFAQFLNDEMLLNGHNIFLDDLEVPFLTQSQLPPLYPPEFELPALTADSSAHVWLDDTGHAAAQDAAEAEDHTTSISRFGSPLPSLEPHVLSSSRSKVRTERGGIYSQGPFPRKISVPEYQVLEQKMTESQKHLPDSFEFPSRHTLSRYVDGFIHGLLEHLPFLHIPTFSIEHASLELVLSMAAIGAEFRFEHDTAQSLFYAARSLIMTPIQSSSQIGQGHEHGQGSTVASVDSATIPTSPLLQKIQAMLTIMVMGSWSSKCLVRESMSLQSLLAWYVREDTENILDDDPRDYSGDQTLSETHWRKWAHFESHRRTRLMAFCFANLQSLAYNVPPVILASEIKARLPASAKEWKASSLQQWTRAHRTTHLSQKSFQEAMDQLFTGTVSSMASNAPFSTASNFVLIHALLQRILILRQTSQTLSEDSVTSIGKALGLWQRQWERSPESNVEPQSPYGPLAFNSTPLLRLAWIRLYSDLGPCRNLASRDPWLIMSAFRQSPPVRRSPGVLHSVLQAAYALSVPVRVGVGFVSKTQTLFWSVQHCLSNLECAIFLSKWFETVAQTASSEPLSTEEKGLIKMIRYMIDESGLFKKDAFHHADGGNWENSVHRLSTAVARIWAEIFKGTHVFDLVNCIGGGLNIYAEMLEKTHTPIRQE